MKSDIYRINSNLGVADGAGDFVATSTWVTGVPAQNQFYYMESDIETVDFVDLGACRNIYLRQASNFVL